MEYKVEKIQQILCSLSVSAVNYYDYSEKKIERGEGE